MSTTNTIQLGYGVGYGNNDDLLVSLTPNIDSACRGADVFLNLSPYAHRHAVVIETGELNLVGEGNKIALQQIIVRTYTNEGSSVVEPDIVVGLRPTADSDWEYFGDSTGTISVTTSACTGTSTAWSNKIAEGDDVTTEFTVPWLASQCRVFTEVGDAYTAVTDHTASGSTITLSSALATGTDLYCFAENDPQVLVEVGDYIYTSEGYHRITAVNTATDIDLAWYPLSTLTGYHRPAKQAPNGEGEVTIGIRGIYDKVQVQIVVIPRNNQSSAEVVKVIGFELKGYHAGERNMREDI